MYTPTITKKEFLNGALKIEVTFTAVDDKVAETFTVSSLEELNRKIREYKKELDAKNVFAKSLILGAYVINKDVVAVQTQAELDEELWFRDFSRLERVTKLKDLGAMPLAWVADYEALVSKVQANAKKAYIANM